MYTVREAITGRILRECATLTRAQQAAIWALAGRKEDDFALEIVAPNGQVVGDAKLR